MFTERTRPSLRAQTQQQEKKASHYELLLNG